MPFDGVTLSSIIYEVKEKLLGGRIDKISQPEKDEIVLSIRSLGKNYKLLLTANASNPRINITNEVKENPMKAPVFCMVLRKHLTNGKLISIEQPEFERIVRITIEAVNEMGDLGQKTIILEIMGKHSNIMLVDENNVVLDSAKHISFATSSVREILPGKLYVMPPSKNKLNPVELNKESFYNRLENEADAKIQNFIYQTYNGISPIMASEICFRVNVDKDKLINELTSAEKENVFNEFSNLMDSVRNNEFCVNAYYSIGVNQNEKPIDYGAIEFKSLNQYRNEKFDSISELLEVFYARKDNSYRISQKSQDLKRLIQNYAERTQKKLILQNKTLKDIENRELYKIYGELITANIYAIENGAKFFITQNYYEEDLPEIKIPLDSTKTAVENAQKYFKRYNKEKRTYTATIDQIKQNTEELEYLESVLSSIQNSDEEADIEEIRNELAEQGFVKKKFMKKGATRIKKTKPFTYVSSDGFMIYVGKNNKQNDELTLKFANNYDMWLHTKDIAGSHVIIKSDRREFSETAIETAANLAAYYSKAKNSSNVPVDYTVKKNVKKPSGAKPGMVIYEHNKTIYVTPNYGEIEKLEQK